MAKRQRNLRLEDELVEKVDKIAKKKFTTRTQYITDAIVDRIKKDEHLLNESKD